MTKIPAKERSVRSLEHGTWTSTFPSLSLSLSLSEISVHFLHLTLINLRTKLTFFFYEEERLQTCSAFFSLHKSPPPTKRGESSTHHNSTYQKKYTSQHNPVIPLFFSHKRGLFNLKRAL